MATQYTDEIGEYNPCLKLRSRNHIKRKCGSSDIDLDKSSVRKEITRKKMHGIFIIYSYNKIVLHIFYLFYK